MPIPTGPRHTMFDGLRARMRALGDYQRGVLRAVLEMVCEHRMRCICIGVGYDNLRTGRHWYYQHFPGWNKAAGRIVAHGIDNKMELDEKAGIAGPPLFIIPNAFL